MSLYLTENFKRTLNKSNIRINIICEIDGFTTFSSTGFSELLRFDEGLFFDESFNFDEIQVNPYANKNANALIQVEGSSSNISQNVRIDKLIEGTRTFNISLLDENNRISRIFSNGEVVDEVIGKKAKVYFSLDDLEHPNDSILFLDGFVTRLQFKNNGTVMVTVEHSIGNTRKQAFTPVTTELVNNYNIGQTGSIEIADATGFVPYSSEHFSNYVKINDEIIKYNYLPIDAITGKNDSPLTTIERAQFGTVEEDHEAGASVETMVRMKGNPFDIALELLLGGSGFAESVTVTSLGQVTPSLFLQDAMLVSSYNLQKELGVTVGDFVNGVVNGNTISNAEITNIVQVGNGNSYIQLKDQVFTSVSGLNDTISFKSRYDRFYPFKVLGAELSARQVDVESFQRVKNQYFLIDEIDILVKEEIEYLEFIQKEIFKPLGIYFKAGARIGIKAHLPPLYERSLKVLNETNIVNPNTISSDRSINKYYYNSTVFKYDADYVTDKFLNSKITIDAESVEKFNVGLRPYKIESKGYRKEANTNAFLNYVSNTILARYSNASEVFKVQCQFNTIDIDVEDNVFLDGVKIYDIQTGQRGVQNKLCEVINKSVDLRNGLVTFTLLDATAYKSKGRYGVVAPSSLVSNINTQRVVLSNSFGNLANEAKKYTDLVGFTFKIYTDDYSVVEEAVVNLVDTENNILYFENNLSTIFWPGNKDIYITIADYNQSSADIDRTAKEVFTYINPTVEVDSVTIGVNNEVTVSGADIGKFFIGCNVDVRGEDGTIKLSTKVSDIISNTIEFEDSYGGLQDTDFIDKIGFSGDNGKAYVIT